MRLLLMILSFLFVSTVHAEFKNIRQDRAEIRKATSAGERKEARTELREDIQKRRDVMKKDIEAKRMEFKTKVVKIKDEKKKLIVEKLDARFNEINAKRTAQMTKHLDKMSEILAKVTGDTASASSAIQTARDAVTAQAAKTYVITISTEANLKMDVGKVRSQLEADLKSVNELVIAARKAVQSLLK